MITPKQASLIFKLLCNQFSTWRIIYKGFFFRVANNRSLIIESSIDPTLISFIKTKEDLALIALVEVERKTAKECFELIREVLTPEQLLELLEVMLRLKVTDVVRKSSPEATISALLRGDTIASYIFAEILTPSKKALASYIKEDCYRFINTIFQDVIISNKDKIPSMVPSQYVMSEACGKIVIDLLLSINKKILDFLYQNPIIKYLCAMFRYYALYGVAAVNDKDAKDILLGNLANRIVSSVLSHYIAVFTDEERKELDSKSAASITDEKVLLLLRGSLNNSIANKFLSKIFTYLIATDPKEKPIEQQNIPSVFQVFLLNPEHKVRYIEFCTVVAVDATVHPKLYDPRSIDVSEELGKDFFKQELLLGLWLAVEEAYNEFKESHEDVVEFIRLNSVSKAISRITKQMSSFLHLGNKDSSEAALIRGLEKRLEKIDTINRIHFPEQASKRNSHGQSLSPPRNVSATAAFPPPVVAPPRPGSP